MRFQKIKRSIESMPRPAYIFFRAVLALAAAMLLGSLLMFAATPAHSRALRHLAVLFLENPAGVLLVGLIGLAFLLDRC
ncbi:MAG: hypothetical protein E7472_05495 [Ruminococcaceae bacterium]|nr:hypothetical protein [Oscillospiraceae bacterium]